jgi:ubiquitin-protein ligase
MSAFEERRIQDVQKLTQLAEQSRARIRLIRVAGNPPNEIDIELHLKTAPSRQYPKVVQDVTWLTISLPARYPLQEPAVTIKTPILHPNVYTSGRICLGMKWMPTFGLDLLVKRIGQIIIFDPTILNEQSPANRDALDWYREAQRRHADAFPTDTWTTISTSEPPRTMTWSNIPSEPAKKVVPCPGCNTKLSLPAGRKGQVKCPRCSRAFEANT